MKVAFFSRLKEIKIPLLSLFYALLFSTRISSRLCAGSFRREIVSLNLFFLPSEEQYYVERVVDARRTRAVVIFCVDFLFFVPFSRNDRKKNQSEKRKVSEGQFFPTKKEEKLCRKEETNKYAFPREIIGGQTRAQTHFSRSIKRPTTLPLSTRYRDFLPVLVLFYFFLLVLRISSRRLLLCSMLMTTMGGERKPCLPRNRERERIFSSSLDAFCLLFVSFFHRDIFSFAKIFLPSVFSTQKRAKKTISPLLLSLPKSLSRALF